MRERERESHCRRLLHQDAIHQTAFHYIIQCFSHHGTEATVWRTRHPDQAQWTKDNGPQCDCNEFETFAANWGFQHITSSPRYPQSNGFIERMIHPQSNGFIERMIQTIKKTMKKAEESNADIDLALLCLRTTPIDSNLPSPDELLYSRKPRSNLPVLDHPTP